VFLLYCADGQSDRGDPPPDTLPVRSGRVFAYEPPRIVFQTLCGNLELKSITNLECTQQGLGNTDGHALIPDIN